MRLFTLLHSSLDAVVWVHDAKCNKVLYKKPGYVIGVSLPAENASAAAVATEKWLLEEEGRDDIEVKVCPCARKAEGR